MTQANVLAASGSQGVSQSLKNRIINGAMVIDQRNAGASVTVPSNVYTMDRWTATSNTGTSKYTVQQNAGSVTPPAGFVNYLGVTSTSSYSIASGEVCTIAQRIEGYNIADLNWGTANAKTITVSFWVRSSLTGTFAGSFRNSDGNRTYPYTYTISSANTWEYKTVTIPGDTTGTWLTNNGVGVSVFFTLGAGSTFDGTADLWQSGNYISVSGATSVVGTSGATFYITGVQLEVGSSATGFEYRQYGQELALCQRYYCKSSPMLAFCYASTNITSKIPFPVSMRTTPTGAYISGNGQLDPITGANVSPSSVNITSFIYDNNSALLVSNNYSGLTVNKTYWMVADNAVMGYSAEL